MKDHIRKGVFWFIGIIVGASLVGGLAIKEEATGQEEVKGVVGDIYLYGEAHGVEAIFDKELEIWQAYYHEQGMRDLFIEMPYYTGELLNDWMQAADDTIFDIIFEAWQGTQSYVEPVKTFYYEIKETCPETVFHATDVGHQYSTLGMMYKKQLEDAGLEDTEAYALTLEAIEQGEKYYATGDDVYRENMMAENFKRAYAAVVGKDIMGIYGAAHTGIGELDFTGQVDSMATQLAEVYAEALHTEDLSHYRFTQEPLNMEQVTVGGKTYQASYFGKEEISWHPNLAQRDFWRLETSYKDFKDYPLNGDNLPQSNYPMQIGEEQVFLIAYTLADGTIIDTFYRSDADTTNTVGITVDEQAWQKLMTAIQGN